MYQPGGGRADAPPGIGRVMVTIHTPVGPPGASVRCLRNHHDSRNVAVWDRCHNLPLCTHSREMSRTASYADAVTGAESPPTTPSDAPQTPATADPPIRTAAFFDLDKKTVIAKSSTLAFSKPFFDQG